MNKYTPLIALNLLIIPQCAYADLSWQQSQNIQLQNQVIQQQQEMDDIQQQAKKQQQQEQLEQAGQDAAHILEEQPGQQQVLINNLHNSTLQMENEQLRNKLRKQQEQLGTQADKAAKNAADSIRVEKEAADNGVVFDDNYYATFTSNRAIELGYNIESMKSLVNSSKEALIRKSKDAAQGDSESQYEMGQYYYAGTDGVKQDKAKAVNWFSKSAAQGYPQAQAMLARCYLEGSGTSLDVKQAFTWYTKAAAQGLPDAQFSLGGFYDLGMSVPQDYKQANVWWQKAADQGHADSQYALAMHYNAGRGASVNPKEAYFWVSLAADKQPEFAADRDRIVHRLTAPEIAEVKKRVRDWKPVEVQVGTGR